VLVLTIVNTPSIRLLLAFAEKEGREEGEEDAPAADASPFGKRQEK